jgi:excinuclease ABC subunit C
LERAAYRKWNIKSEDLTPGDDYAMMREVLKRRFARLLKEGEDAAPPPPAEDDPMRHPGARAPHFNGCGAPPQDLPPEQTEAAPAERPASWPDLVLIDGGAGQLAAALDTLAELGLGPGDVNLIAIAKGPERDAGRETFFRPGRAPMKLEPSSPVLYFLQRLRDEAHRFAIEAHRAKRAADVKKNPLDEIPGVGAARKRALLAHFGSARAVSRASLDDLEGVEGVSRQLARKIYEWFQDER